MHSSSFCAARFPIRRGWTTMLVMRGVIRESRMLCSSQPQSSGPQSPISSGMCIPRERIALNTCSTVMELTQNMAGSSFSHKYPLMVKLTGDILGIVNVNDVG